MRDERSEHLTRFRATHRSKMTAVGDIAWDYISCGQGTDTLVPLQGAGGIAEAAIEQIPWFEPHFRVIAPTCPAAATTMRQLFDGLESILDRERVGQAHVLGHSLGGALALCFVRSHIRSSIGHIPRTKPAANLGVCRPYRLDGVEADSTSGDLFASTGPQLQAGRPPLGSRQARGVRHSGQGIPCRVSIHAPARGATPPGLTMWHIFSEFQSTPPREGRRGPGFLLSQGEKRFNPRPRARGDDLRGSCDGLRRVSIHAPARGATKDHLRVEQTDTVSIHAPARGATPAGERGGNEATFQSTPPREGRRERGPDLHRRRGFQSTPPREGRLSSSTGLSPSRRFQSTPPREGRLPRAARLFC